MQKYILSLNINTIKYMSKQVDCRVPFLGTHLSANTLDFKYPLVFPVAFDFVSLSSYNESLRYIYIYILGYDLVKRQMVTFSFAAAADVARAM